MKQMAKTRRTRRLGWSTNDCKEIEKTSEMILNETPIAFLADGTCKCLAETEALDMLAMIFSSLIPYL